MSFFFFLFSKRTRSFFASPMMQAPFFFLNSSAKEEFAQMIAQLEDSGQSIAEEFKKKKGTCIIGEARKDRVLLEKRKKKNDI